MVKLGDAEGASEMQGNIDMINSHRGVASSSLDDYHKQLQECRDQGDLSGTAELLGLIADAYADRYDWEKATEYYHQSLEAFRQLGDAYSEAQTLFNMSVVYKEKGAWDKAIDLLESCMKAFTKLSASPCAGIARLHLGEIKEKRGASREAEELIQSAVDTFEDLGAIPDLSEAYLSMAGLKLRLGLHHEAKFYLSEAEALIYRIDYEPMRIQLYNLWGQFYQEEKFYSEANKNYGRALAHSRRLGNLYQEAKALRNLGSLARLEGKRREAEEDLRGALAIFNQLGGMYDIACTYDEMTELYLEQKDYAKAEEMASLTERQARALGYSDLRVKAISALADCKLHSGRHEEALVDLSQALNLGKEHGEETYAKTAYLLMGKLADYLEEASRSRGSVHKEAPVIEWFLKAMQSKLEEKGSGGLMEKAESLKDEISRMQN
jgi:tetratricopeptide (TPR) repeat protein